MYIAQVRVITYFSSLVKGTRLLAPNLGSLLPVSWLFYMFLGSLEAFKRPEELKR